jgi:trans-2,3-dihydro-3-hydroxyanthranilate isomerase
MQAIAREFNLSETIFVMAPDDPAHTARARIFMPRGEMPFAGHPTLGCAVLLAEMAQGPGDWQATVTLEEPAGLVPVVVTRQGGVTAGSITAPRLPAPHRGRVAEDLIPQALGLTAAEIGFDSARPGLWEGGPAFLYVPLRDREALARARPCEPHWSRLVEAADVDCAYLYTPAKEADFAARLFAPTSGIAEDPATGSATAILAAQIDAFAPLPPGTSRFSLVQGIEMGRPSRLSLEIDKGSEITAIRVGGAAVRLAEGRITPP